MLQNKQKTMALGKSVAEELLNALKMPKLRAMPSYISEADTVSVDDFMQSRYACDYVLDTSNVHWGGEINTNHVFDIYSEYHQSRDSNKVRLEMLEYITVNSERYAWDCYILLCMSGLSLSDWRAKMAFWANPADTVVVYALSDQFGLHTSVITNSKLWTTVTPEFQGTQRDVLDISPIKLLYMGANRFGRIWKKVLPDQPSFYGPNFNYQPMLPLTSVPSTDDVETACTLVQIGDNVSKYLQDTEITTPPMFEGPAVTIGDDAMDKSVGKYDVCMWKPSLCTDAMDQIVRPTEKVSVTVETKTATKITKVVKVETKWCSVKLVRLDSILLGDTKDRSTSEEDIAKQQTPAGLPRLRPKIRQTDPPECLGMLAKINSTRRSLDQAYPFEIVRAMLKTLDPLLVAHLTIGSEHKHSVQNHPPSACLHCPPLKWTHMMRILR